MALLFLALPDDVSMAKTVELLRKHQTPADTNNAVFESYFEQSQAALREHRYVQLLQLTFAVIKQTVSDVKRNLYMPVLVLTPIYSALAYWVTLLKGAPQQQAIQDYYQHIRELGPDNNNFKLKLYLFISTRRAALLFNSFPDVQLFRLMIQLSVELKNTSLIISPIVQDITGFLNQWKLTANEQKQFLLEILQILAPCPDQPQAKILISYYILTKFQITDPKEAQSVFVIFLNANPTLIQIGRVVSTQAYSVLAPTLAQYIQLIVDGNIAQLQDHIAKGELSDLNTALGARAVKLNRLAIIADTKPTFTYAELAAELNIPDEDVERWIISAIQLQIVQAKIDQNSRTVTIVKLQNLQSKIKASQ